MKVIDALLTLLTYQNLTWNLLAIFEENSDQSYFNVAMPSQGPIYYITVIPENKIYTFSSNFTIDKTIIDYSSLVAYDGNGYPLPDCYYSVENIDNNVTIPLHKTPYPVTVIYRIYPTYLLPVGNIIDYTKDFLLNVYDENGNKIDNSSLENAKNNSKLLENEIRELLSYITVEPSWTGIPFYKPSTKKLEGVYGNPDSNYLIHIPPHNVNYTVVKGKMQNIEEKDYYYIKYIGFMLTNYKTTQTEHSTMLSRVRNWGSEYCLLILYDGFVPKEYIDCEIMQFDTDNMFKMIVYKSLDTSCYSEDGCRGLSVKAGLSPIHTEIIMGEHYPEVFDF